ncbi:YmjA family protein [Phytobacter sp. V91]|uniref:YmjA family protein n=1 Tax=Phytobacter sp. V91 TaxID=3369425 RepID=UPI003F61CE6A
MNEEIPLKYYDIADEYATEADKPVSDAERDALARYFQLLITRLMNNEEISEEAQSEMAKDAGIDPQRIDDIANFLNQWGNEE